MGRKLFHLQCVTEIKNKHILEVLHRLANVSFSVLKQIDADGFRSAQGNGLEKTTSYIVS